MSEADASGPSPPAAMDEAARRQLAADAAERLGSSLDQVLGDTYRRTPEHRDVYADGVVVTAFGLLERCPRRAANPAEDYLDSVPTTRRRVGLLALRRLWRRDLSRGADGQVAAVVAEVADDPDEWPPRLRDWFDELDPPGRAALSSAVATWCLGVLGVVGRSPRVVWTDPSRAGRTDVPGRLVRLNSPVDAVTGALRSERLLMIADGVDTSADRVRAGYAALSHGLGRRLLPVGVSVGVPSQGLLRRHTVTADLVDLALDRVVEHVALRAAGSAAPARPGPGCRHCHLLEVCNDGLAHVELARVTAGRGPTAGGHEEPRS